MVYLLLINKVNTQFVVLAVCLLHFPAHVAEMELANVVRDTTGGRSNATTFYSRLLKSGVLAAASSLFPHHHQITRNADSNQLSSFSQLTLGDCYINSPKGEDATRSSSTQRMQGLLRYVAEQNWGSLPIDHRILEKDAWSLCSAVEFAFGPVSPLYFITGSHPSEPRGNDIGDAQFQTYKTGNFNEL
ncbi:hypothetical protein [Alteromonas stellipolaris]|uniref:hypothetical protein n=1 Tax=Alteromonas stellipolaris TaxID=233316 RepID=UPI003565D7B3